MSDKINQLYTILKSKQEAGEVGEIPTLEKFTTTLADEKSAREMYESRKDRFPDIFYGNSFEEWYPTVKKKDSTSAVGNLPKDVSTPKSESSSKLWGQNLKEYEEKNRPSYTGPAINQNAMDLIQKGKDSLAVDSTDIDRIIGQAGNQFDVFGEGVKIAPRFGKERYTSEEMAGRVNRSEASLEYFQELSKKRDSQLNKFADKYKKAADLKLAETSASIESFSLNAQNAYKQEVEDFKNTLPQPKTEEEAAALNKQLQDFNKTAFDKLNAQVKKFSETKATEYRNYIDKNINEEWDKEANAGAKVYDKENTSRIKGIFESDKFQKLPYLDQKALVGSVWYREKLRLMKQGKTPKEVADAKDWFYLQALGSSISNPKNKTPLSPFAIRSWAENMTNEIDARIVEQKKELPGNNLGLDQQNFIPQMKDLQNLEQAKALIAEINNMPDEDLGEYWEGATAANKIPFASAVNELGKNLRLYEVATKENRSKADDLLLLAKGMQTDIESVIDPSFSYKVGKQTAEMLPYIGEFIVTGGAFTGAQAATTEMLTKKLGSWASSKVAQRAVIKPLGVLMGTLAQTTANPQMYLNNMVERMSPRFEASFSEKGSEIVSKLDYNTKDLEGYSTGHGEDAFTAALRGYGLAVSEIFTERLGELAFEPAGAAIAKKMFGDPELAKRMTLAMWLKKRNITPEQGAMEILTKQMAWNGIISELGEELVNMPLSNIISDRPIGEGMDADNLSVLAATIVSVGAVTGGLNAASKALSNKTTPLSYTVNGEERTIEVSPDMAKAVDFMNKKPDYFDIEQFKNSVFPNVDMPEKDREVLIGIMNAIQDKADLKPFTEKNGPIYNRIDGETEENGKPQEDNLIDITGYQTDAEKEESEGYARQLPPHQTPKQELKNIEKALKKGNLTEDEVNALQGRYQELSTIIQKEIDEKEAKKAKEEAKIAKKEESDRLRAEREAKRKEEPLVPVEWSPMVNDVIVGRVNKFNTMSDAKKGSKKGLELLNQIGKSAGAHNLELKEVKSGVSTRLEVFKDGKKLQKTPLPTEFEDATPEQYEFAQRAIKYGLIPPGADMGLTDTEMKESLAALKAGKNSKQALRLVHAIDKAKAFHGVDIADVDANGKKTGRRTFVSFDDIEEIMNEGFTGPAITPEEEEILAAAYDELYGSLDEIGQQEIDNLFITDNDTNNGKQEENENQQAGSGQKNENDNGSPKKSKRKTEVAPAKEQEVENKEQKPTTKDEKVKPSKDKSITEVSIEDSVKNPKAETTASENKKPNETNLQGTGEVKVNKSPKPKTTKKVGNDNTNSALDDIGDIFMEQQIDMFSMSDPRRGKSDLRNDYEKTLSEATKELKDAGKDLESTKQAAKAKGVEENTLNQILRPKQARYDLALKQYQIIKDLEKRVKEGEQSQQTLFDGRVKYNPDQMTLDFNNPQQVEISHGGKENLFKNIQKTVKGIEGHYNFNDYKEQVEAQLGGQAASDVILKYITERTILQEFKQNGFVSLVGKKIHGPQDVADAMLIFRSPFVEHMMVVVVDTYGNVIHNATFTINHPRMVGIDTRNVVDNIEQIELANPGTKTYLSHNHPSGNHNPSEADKKMTIEFAKRMADAGLNFGGHIVIDTTKFTFIDGEGVATTKDYKSLPEKFFKPRLNVQKNEGYLEPSDLMGVAKTIFENQGFNEMAFFLDSMNSISYASVVPVGMNEGQTKLWLERNMRANGSPFVFIASKLGNTKSNYEYQEVRDYIYIDESNKTIESWVNRGYFNNGSKKILSGTIKDNFRVVGFASAQEEENPYLSQALADNSLMAKANLVSDIRENVNATESIEEAEGRKLFIINIDGNKAFSFDIGKNNSNKIVVNTIDSGVDKKYLPASYRRIIRYAAENGLKSVLFKNENNEPYGQLVSVSKEMDRGSVVIPNTEKETIELPITNAIKDFISSQGIYLMESETEYNKPVQLSPENISKLQGLTNTLFSQGHTKFEDIMNLLINKYGVEKVTDSNNSQGVSMLNGMKAVYSSMLPFLDGDQYSDFKDVKNYNPNDNTSTELGAQSDSGTTPNQEQVLPGDVQPELESGQGRIVGTENGEFSIPGLQHGGDLFSPQPIPPTSGESGVGGLRGGERGVESSDNTSSGPEQLGLFGTSGVQPESKPRAADEEHRNIDGTQRQYTDKLEAQKNAPKTAIIGDIKNIAQTLPYLMDGQIEDVWKAETRMLKDGKKGILFGNQTGTGKTLLFLGVAYRTLLNDPNAEIIIISPKGPIQQTINSAKILGMDFVNVEDRKDAGAQLSITTYQNFYKNKELLARTPALVIFDESQNLLENQQGDESVYLKAARELVSTPNEAPYKAAELLYGKQPEWVDMGNNEDYHRWREVVERNKEAIAIKGKALEQKTKVMLMSATPFAHEFGLRYADGILFSIDQGVERRTGGGYNSGSNDALFFITNFGYRMRYNKLTRPDAKVNIDVMYRAFADKLMKEGAMSTRLMDVPFDYSREFIDVGRGAGTKIDDGIDLLESERYRFPTSDAFSYQYLAPLLEAIKAKESVKRIKQHLELGRKVVVFHGYNNPVPEHPFGPRLLKFAKTAEQMDALQMFWAEHPEYKEMTLGLKNPIQTYSDAFGDKVLFINGGVSDVARERNKNLFNQDPNYNIIVVNMSAGGAGLSLHDDTGANQRALMNLGLPVRPVFTIQTEGRTYRTGQKSNAVFEYLITGLNFEMVMFGTKIAERVNATEALVLGSMARNLREVFRKGYIEANTLPPSLEQGVGGKEGDKTIQSSTPYEYAKSLFWGQQKGRKNDLGKDYFATPEPIGLKMMEFGDIKTGEKVLEPSAGHGAIARFAPEDAVLHIVEPSSELRARLIVNISPDRVVASNFEDYYVGNHYNVIAMNPPFGSGGKTAMGHVAKAFKHLYNGGRLVAIIPNGQGEARFSKWYESEDAENAVLVAKIEMPAMFNERAGTGALTSIYIIDRIEDEEIRAAQQPALYISYAGAKDNNELFDRIENLSIRPRVEVPLNDEAMNDLKEAAMQKELPFTDHEFIASSGQKWLIARLTERVDYKEGFKPISEIAKKNNGWYMKKGGKGFAFKEDNDRQQFKQEAYAFIKNLNPESDIDGMVSEAEADLRDFIRKSMSQMNANPFGTIIEFGAKLGKVLGLRIIQGANSLVSILDRLGIPATDTIRRLWVKMNAVAEKYWRQPKNIVTLKQPYIYIGMRNVPYFGAVMNRAFDGTTNMHQVFFNLNTEITNMDILIIGNPTAPTTPMLRLVKQATTELMTFITYMNHADTMAYVDDLRRDRLPAPILYDYAYTEKESLVYNYVYGFRPIDTLIKNLRSAGAIISENENPVIGTDLYPGRVADKARSFEESVISSVKGPFGKPVHGASLIERMIKDGINLGEMDAKTRSAHGETIPGFYLGFTYGYETVPTFPEYLHALHAKERNAEVAKRRQERWENKKIELENNIANNISVGLNRAKLELLVTNMDPEYQLIPDGGSGMFDYEADAILDEMLNNPEKLALYNQYAAEFTREVIMPIQEELVRTGQLSQDKMDELNQMFPNWVHLPVDFYSKDLNSTGLASSKVRSPLKKVKGSLDRRVNPFLATIDYYSKVLRAGEMNLARQQMYNLIRKYPNENLFKIVPPVSGVYYDPDSGVLMPEFSAEPPNSIPVYRNGQIYYIQFVGKNGARLYDAWMSINKTHDRTLIHKAFRALNAALYFANIKFNPTFLITNLIRDDIASILNALALDEVQQANVKALLAAKIPVYTPLAIRAAYQASRGKNTAINKTMLDYAIRLQNQGGLTVLGNIVGGQTLDERVDKMMELINAMDGMSLMKQLSMPGSYLLNALGDMQSAVENGTRIAAFRASIEAGLSDQAAAAIAKNITVNFDRKGSIGGALNDFIWLFKTSASGVARFAKAVNSKEGKYIASGLIGMGAALALWNRSRCPEAWDGLDPQIKLTKLVFVTDCEHLVYPSIPFAQGWSFFVYLGQVMADYSMNALDGEKATANVALAALNSTNPTGTSTDYESFASNFMPTALDKGIEFAVNKTWYGKPIRPEQYDFEDKMKKSELYWDETSEWAKQLATWLSTNTGGSNAKNAGRIEMSPATLEYLFKTLTGGAGRDVAGSGVLISDIQEGNFGENITKYPMVRALVTKVSSQTVMREMYKLYDHGTTNPITVEDTEKFAALTKIRLVQVQKIQDPEEMQKEFAKLEAIIMNYSNLKVKDMVSNMVVDKNLKEISKIVSAAKK